jgi:glycosyltransferase involved in cell wall biosynthesis
MTLLFIYSLFLLVATLIWHYAPRQPHLKGYEKVSAIIVVRNEEQNIVTLLESLKKQTYSDFEVIVVDDGSDDSTVNLIQNFNLKNLKLLHLTNDERKNAPKKAGIEKAIRNAEGSIIFSTDGDCILPPKIIENYAGFFSNPKVHFISGPVTFIKEPTLWNNIQIVEFASLVGSAAVAIFLKNPIMSSAANLAYRKTSYLEVNGFQENDGLASGDDEFLMNKIHKTYKDSVIFAKNKECIVETKATENLTQFYNQRKRWAGKWGASISWVSKITAVLIFVINAITIYFAMSGNWEILLFRLITEFIFLGSVLHSLNKKSSIWFIPITQLFYPFYVVFFGLISLIPREYEWKGRKLR